MQWFRFRCTDRIPLCPLYRLQIPGLYRTTPPRQGNLSERKRRGRYENAVPAVLRKSNPGRKECRSRRSAPHLPGNHSLCEEFPPACRPGEVQAAFPSILTALLPLSFRPDTPAVCWSPDQPEFPLSLPPFGPADGEGNPGAVISYRKQSPAPQNILWWPPVSGRNRDVQSGTQGWLRYRKSSPSCAFPMPEVHPLPHPQRKTPFYCGILMSWGWP